VNLRGYLKLAQAPFQMMLAYRTATFLECLGVVLRVVLMRFFWTAVYGGSGAVEGITLPMMITYATLSNVQEVFTESYIHWIVQQKVRDGNVVIELIRPYGFLRSLLASSLGSSLLWNGPMAGLVFAASLFFVNLQRPASPTAGLAYLASVILALGVNFCFAAMIGLAAFWTVELTAFNMIFYFLSVFLSGGLVPLWFLPTWVQRIAAWLPFQSLAHLPLSIYIGKIEGAAVWIALLKQVAWIGVLSAIAWLIWKAAERKVIVQGG
jgi:ABC-2 type transport system permease protein